MVIYSLICGNLVESACLLGFGKSMAGAGEMCRIAMEMMTSEHKGKTEVIWKREEAHRIL